MLVARLPRTELRSGTGAGERLVASEPRERVGDRVGIDAPAVAVPGAADGKEGARRVLDVADEGRIVALRLFLGQGGLEVAPGDLDSLLAAEGGDDRLVEHFALEVADGELGGELTILDIAEPLVELMASITNCRICVRGREGAYMAEEWWIVRRKPKSFTPLIPVSQISILVEKICEGARRDDARRLLGNEILLLCEPQDLLNVAGGHRGIHRIPPLNCLPVIGSAPQVSRDCGFELSVRELKTAVNFATNNLSKSSPHL